MDAPSGGRRPGAAAGAGGARRAHPPAPASGPGVDQGGRPLDTVEDIPGGLRERERTRLVAALAGWSAIVEGWPEQSSPPGDVPDIDDYAAWARAGAGCVRYATPADPQRWCVGRDPLVDLPYPDEADIPQASRARRRMLALVGPGRRIQQVEGAPVVPAAWGAPPAALARRVEDCGRGAMLVVGASGSGCWAPTECRVPGCPVCVPRRARLRASGLAVVAALWRRAGGHVAMWTRTVPAVVGRPLSEAHAAVSEPWRRMWDGGWRGGMRALAPAHADHIEATARDRRGRRRWHVHAHTLLWLRAEADVAAGPDGEVEGAWWSRLRDDWCRVTGAAPQAQSMRRLPGLGDIVEAAKYPAKTATMDDVQMREWVVVMRGRRLARIGGALHGGGRHGLGARARRVAQAMGWARWPRPEVAIAEDASPREAWAARAEAWADVAWAARAEAVAAGHPTEEAMWAAAQVAYRSVVDAAGLAVWVAGRPTEPPMPATMEDVDRALLGIGGEPMWVGVCGHPGAWRVSDALRAEWRAAQVEDRAEAIAAWVMARACAAADAAV